jgi:G3E family GTPase
VNPTLIFDVDEGVVEAGESHQPTAEESLPRQTHVHDGICARSLKFAGKLDREKFLKAVESIPPSIFRIKGIIELSDSPLTMLFQYVAGRYELSAFPHVRTPDRFLTLVGKVEDTGVFVQAEKLIRVAES